MRKLILIIEVQFKILVFFV